jgi:hypothetical protein
MGVSGAILILPNGTIAINGLGQIVTEAACGGCPDYTGECASSYLVTGKYDGIPFTAVVDNGSFGGVGCQYDGQINPGPSSPGVAELLGSNTPTCGWDLLLPGGDVSHATRFGLPPGPYPDVVGFYHWTELEVG